MKSCFLRSSNVVSSPHWNIKRVLFLSLFFLLVGTVYGQKGVKVSGTIIDDLGAPIPGVSIVEEGTTNGIVTNMDGKYLLTLKSESAKLTYSFIGFINLTETVGTKTEINLTMLEDLEKLDEVLVVGYGTVKKQDLTGSMGSMESESIVATRSSSSLGALTGSVPGVDILKAGNKPGAGFTVNVRGINTFGGSTQPLYVVDGMIVSSINDINPDDIERMDVLKDASSAAIYGSRGSNGVVIITTKSGKEGKVSFDFNSYVGTKGAYNLPDIMNAEEFVQFGLDSQVGKNDDDPQLLDFLSQEEIDMYNDGQDIDWPSLISSSATVQNYSLSASGGGNGQTYSYGVGYLADEGVVGNEKYERYTLRSSNQKEVNKFLSLGLRNTMTYSVRDEGSKEALRSAYRLRPIGIVYNDDGSLRMWPSPRESQIPNPLVDMNNVTRETKSIHYFGNLFIELKPIEGLSFRSTFSPEIEFTRYGEFRGAYTKSAKGVQSKTRAYYNTSNTLRYTFDNMLNYSKDFGDHHFKAMVLSSVYSSESEAMTSEVRDFSTDHYKFFNLGAGSDIRDLSSSYSKETMSSGLGRINYDYKEKYYVTVNGRYDGSSRLAADQQWAFFPSAALSWRASEEEFMSNFDKINTLKFRLSYGNTGNARISPYGTQVTLNTSNYSWGDDGASGVILNAMQNEGLSWEKMSEVNFGIDFALFNSRVSGSVDLYSRTSTDILYAKSISSLNGFSSAWDNIGSMRNNGIEVGLNTVNVQSGNFRWTTGLNFSSNRSQILDIDGSKEDNLGNGWFIGEDIQSVWQYEHDGIWQLDEADEAAIYSQDPGEVKVVDQDGNGDIDTEDRVIIGKQTPDWYGSITNTFTYKSLDLSFLVTTRQGAISYSGFHEKFAWDQDGRFNGLKLNYWTPDNPSGTWHQPGNGGSYQSIERYQDVSFTKIGYINLGYNFSKSVIESMKMQKLRVYISAQNPFTFTNYGGLDPELANDGGVWGSAVMTRSVLFGIDLKF